MTESSVCILKRLSPWATPVIIISNKPDPLNPGKQQLHFAPDYCLLNKFIKTTNSGNKVISYYPLPNITDILARSQNCRIFSSLDLRCEYHHICLTPETKQLSLLLAESGTGM